MARQIDYYAYLDSYEWASMREEILLRADGYCEVCRWDRPEHVHHITYERLGNEAHTDLLAVCASCHEQIHARSWPPPIDADGHANWHACWSCLEPIPPYVTNADKDACPFCGTGQEDWLADR